MPITDNLIPPRAPEDCGVIYQTSSYNNCETKTLKPDFSYKILFPEGAINFPLAGGTTISGSYKNSNAVDSFNAVSIFTNELSFLNNFNIAGDKLDLLTRLRININLLLRKVAAQSSIRNKHKLPKIFISTYVGDDTKFSDNRQSSSEIYKICEFQYIPSSIVKYIADKISNIDKVKDLVGISGVKFSELKNQDFWKIAFELFPIFNLSENDIVKHNNLTTDGGYYTFNFDTEEIIIKMPDISGKNSYGISNDIFQDRNFYFEVSDKYYQRIKIENVSIPPSINFVSDIPNELPENDNLEFIVTSNKDLTSAYLSVISNGVSKFNIQNLNSSDALYEIYTAPILTAPVLSQTSPTFDITDNLDISKYISSLREYLSEYFALNETVDALLSKNSINKLGIASTLYFTSPNLILDPNTYFGEKNRPDVILYDDKLIPSSLNDNKYYSNKISSTKQLFCESRPKIYQKEQIPELWIKTIDIQKNSDGNYIISFHKNAFDNINKDNLSNLKFVLYGQDIDGQLARVPKVINLDNITPLITDIEPTGFRNSKIIQYDNNLVLNFHGEHLNKITKVIVRDTSENVLVQLELGITEGLSLFSEDNLVSLLYKSPKELLLSTNTEYYISVATKYSESNHILIYVATDSDSQINKPDELVLFKNNDLTFAISSTTTLTEIPIIPDKNSEIIIKSKSGIFKRNSKVYMYLAVDSSLQTYLNKLEPDSKIKTLKTDKFSISVASTIEYSLSSAGDFARINNKKAKLKFPGDSFSNYNFMSLLDKSNFYFLLTNQPISQINDSSEKDYYYLLQVGDSNYKSFSTYPLIYGYAGLIDGKLISNISIDKFKDFKTEFGNFESADISNISTFDKIDKLGIIFYSRAESGNKQNYDFYIGPNNINHKISSTINNIENSQLYYIYFDDIKIKEQGKFNLFIKKNDKKYNVKSSSEIISRYITFDASLDEFYYNQDDNSLTVTTENTSIVTSNSIKFTELIPTEGSGLSAYLDKDNLRFYSPVTILSLLDFHIGEENFIGGTSNEDIIFLNTLSLSIPENTLVLSKNHNITAELDQTKIFNRVNFYNSNIINFNIPEILSISRGRHSIPNQKPTEILISADEEYTANVLSSEKEMALMFNDEIIIKPSQVRKLERDNNYQIVFKAPNKLIGNACPVVLCISVVNAERDKAIKQLGEKFVLDENSMTQIISGVTKKKIPDVTELKDLINSFPLRFGPVKLSQSMAPPELINSFCDMSFHLAGDLKVALNGFQTLMVPIQIIFCILDVICALVNPVKLAKAVIRLFQCLYDLVLLLPQISVPVMYLQLSLHLLKLLECVFDKVISIVTAINEIINALSLAKERGAWNTIKSLEETLSELANDLKVSLEFLGPVSTILGIFLELLALIFRFPCRISEDDEAFCMDGSVLGGVVLGYMINDDDTINFSNLLPIVQAYTERTIDEAIQHGSSEPLIEPSAGLVIGTSFDSANYLDSMNINQDNLKSTYAGTPTASGKINASFSASATKSRKGFGNDTIVEFQFKEKGRNGFFNKKKIIDPDQNLDGPIYLVEEQANALKVSVSDNLKNFISPVDSETFIRIHNGLGTVKPLTITFDLPIYDTDPETGNTIQTGTQTVTRTFDSIPKLAIVDENYSLYFIEEGGIIFNNDGAIESIKAKVINQQSAQKLKFLKEDDEIDTDGDGTADDEAPVFDFPQLYFFDMRAAANDIQQKCLSNSLNSFVLDTPDVTDLVDNGQECITNYSNVITGIADNIKTAISSGTIPDLIDLTDISKNNKTLEDCINDNIDELCYIVVNSLNSQFKVLEDSTTSTSDSLPDFTLDPELLDGFESDSPSLTGAREYAAGIGDDAIIIVGDYATIQVTPRDSYDIIMSGDLSERILIEVISDSTGSFRFIDNNNKIFDKVGDDYFAKCTADNPGVVKIKAKICGKIIQAVTYTGIEEQISQTDVVDCVPDSTELNSGNNIPLGDLTKIDRVITLTFKAKNLGGISSVSEGPLARTNPQTFGTALEN